jgi:hypothetical protein
MLSPPQGHSAARRIISMESSSDTIEPAIFQLVAQGLNELRIRVKCWCVSSNVRHK